MQFAYTHKSNNNESERIKTKSVLWQQSLWIIHWVVFVNIETDFYFNLFCISRFSIKLKNIVVVIRDGAFTIEKLPMYKISNRWHHSRSTSKKHRICIFCCFVRTFIQCPNRPNAHNGHNCVEMNGIGDICSSILVRT